MIYAGVMVGFCQLGDKSNYKSKKIYKNKNTFLMIEKYSIQHLSNERVLKIISKAKMSNTFLEVSPPQNVSLDNRQ